MDISFVDLGRGGEPGTQAVARKQGEAFGFGRVGSDAALQGGGFNQPGDVFPVRCIGLVGVFSRGGFRIVAGAVDQTVQRA